MTSAAAALTPRFHLEAGGHLLESDAQTPSTPVEGNETWKKQRGSAMQNLNWQRPKEHKMKNLVNTFRAADILGLQPNTLEIWRCRNKGPRYIKLGRRVLYDIAELEEFARTCTVETNNDAMLRHHALSSGGRLS